jgi:hypothetical protein
MNDAESNKNIDLLRKVIQDKNDVAFFVGAGPSIPIGINNWKKLLKEMNRKFGCSINVENSIKAKGYPATASEIYNKCVNNHDDYLQFMRDQCKSRNCDYTSIHLAMIDSPIYTIITTNFDSAFEKAFEYKNININSSTQKLPSFNISRLFNDTPSIVYIHGNKDSGDYIFREEEYEVYYPSISQKTGSGELERFLQEIISKVSLVFIGFSFEDLYFKKFLDKALNEIIKEKEIYKQRYAKDHPGKSVDHFVFLEKKEKNKADNLKRLGLKVISYDDRMYVQIGDVLKSLQPPISL